MSTRYLVSDRTEAARLRYQIRRFMKKLKENGDDEAVMLLRKPVNEVFDVLARLKDNHG